jgi:hypothetical protein
MTTRLRTATAAVAGGFLTACLALGCGGGPPPVDTTTAEANVHGTITFKGKPVAKGEVAFDPSNYVRKNEASRRVEIGKDGSYSVKTLAGINRITFRIPEMMHDAKLQDLSLEFQAKPGDNTYNMDLPPAGAAP